MEILFALSGYLILFLVIYFAVRTGINDSKELLQIRNELSTMKSELERIRKYSVNHEEEEFTWQNGKQ
ncbi:hypothetical protein [Fictibacillus phosphorivorans]|uniref:Uncharacterized protein n=1 Tax=Fictibacillus phosphorivorans TaxID=1221500 RepID=A0A160IMB7_9BACL|nr:hypothetical protein [Fictibacillus phosphorivorans]ANC77274.1 hypothetical protein ABE65_010850 [Fictibacillus phosphorivorans]MQR94548.1 hypothetical protein [Fictibacillus phosphorivorans]